MLNLTEEQKKIFYTGTYFNGYKMHFPALNLTIDNNTLHSEAVTIKESICDEEDLMLGGCIASSCEFEVSEILQNELSGLEFSTTLEVMDEDGNMALELPMGTYRVNSAALVDDKDYKKIVAYDALYNASADVSEWYNALFPAEEKSVTKLQDGKEVTLKVVEYGTVKLKAMRESLLQHLGIPYETQDLINDDMDVEKTVAPAAGSLTGAAVLKAICTVNGGFGRINRQGKFEVVQLNAMHTIGLYPSARLFPSKRLYPVSTKSASDDLTKLSGASDTGPEYRSIRCEEYTTDKITCLNIQTDEEDIGVTVGTDLSNPYLITGNFLLYGKNVEELKKVGSNILEELKGIYYRPVSELKLNTLPYLETGDMIVAEKEAEKVYSYIFSRTISGIQALVDTYEAKGGQKRQNEVTQESELTQLKGRTLKIQKNIDSVYIEMANVEKKTSTRFEQTDSTIVLKVDSDGRLVEVALGADPDTAKTYFTVDADNIDLNAEDVFNIISGGTLNLSGKKITIASDLFNVTEEGEVEAKSIDIKGGSVKLETTQGTDSYISLKNLENHVYIEGYEVEIDVYGEGAPEGTIAELFSYYLDTENLKLYQFCSGDEGVKWYEETEPYTVKQLYIASSLDAENGFVAENYETKNGKKQGSAVYINGEGIRLIKDFIAGSIANNEVEITTSYGDSSGTGQDVETDLLIKAKIVVDALKFATGSSAHPRIYYNGYNVECLGAPFSAANGLVVQGLRLVNGSIVRNLATDPLPSTGVLSIPAPGIDPTRPAVVCNGDGDAAKFSIGTVTIVPSTECIEVQLTNVELASIRVSYSYWSSV